MKGFFITGTGTEIGKTFVTATLCHQLREAGKNVRPLKPALSGYAAEDFDQTDTVILLKAAGIEPNTAAADATTPWRFSAPLAPNMAAAREGKELDFNVLVDFCAKALSGLEDYCLIEGAGGAFSPLTNDRLNIDLAAALEIPLGTVKSRIHHALGRLREAMRVDVLS